MELKVNLPKKIQEIAEKSGGIRKHYPGVWQFFDNELEMMYNEIVKECAVMCRWEHEAEIMLQTMLDPSGVEE